MLDLFAAFPPGSLIAFMLSGIVLNLAPGPDVLFATASGLQGGPRAGAAAGLGVGFGAMLHVSLAALGLSALIAAHPEALRAIKWAGAAYLLWLAWRSWNAPAPAAGARGAVRPRRALARGFLTNALNPKPVLFLLAFLPQFTSPAYGPLWQQVVALGSIFAVTGTAITAGYGAAAGILGQALGARLSIMNRIAALVFGGLAVRLAME